MKMIKNINLEKSVLYALEKPRILMFPSKYLKNLIIIPRLDPLRPDISY